MSTAIIPTLTDFHAIPKDFPSWKKDDREAFLKVVWGNKEKSCTLYDCYAQGKKLTQILSALSFFVGKLKERVGEPKEGEPTAQKLGRSFAMALNRACHELGKAAYQNCMALVNTGTFPEKGPALPPVTIPDLFPEESEDEVLNTLVKIQDQTIGDVILSTLKMLCNDNKFLNHVYPMKGPLSFMQLILAAVKAGEDFYNEWVKDPSKLPLNDGKKEAEEHKEAITEGGGSAVTVSNRTMAALKVTSFGPTIHAKTLVTKQASWVEVDEPVWVPSAFPDDVSADAEEAL